MAANKYKVGKLPYNELVAKGKIPVKQKKPSEKKIYDFTPVVKNTHLRIDEKTNTAYVYMNAGDIKEITVERWTA